MDHDNEIGIYTFSSITWQLIKHVLVLFKQVVRVVKKVMWIVLSITILWVRGILVQTSLGIKYFTFCNMLTFYKLWDFMESGLIYIFNKQ